MSKPKVNCHFDEMVDVSALTPHPKNRNKHPAAQIEQLADIILYQGWRRAVTVSKRSGYVTKGHGRIQAAERREWDQVPVEYQDYESEEQEYADVQADNAIAAQAELDLEAIKLDLIDLQLDPAILGIAEIDLDPLDVKAAKFPELPEGDKSDYSQVTFTLHSSQLEILQQAISKSKDMGPFDYPNENSNGNALTRVCEIMLEAEVGVS